MFISTKTSFKKNMNDLFNDKSNIIKPGKIVSIHNLQRNMKLCKLLCKLLSLIVGH